MKKMFMLQINLLQKDINILKKCKNEITWLK